MFRFTILIIAAAMVVSAAATPTAAQRSRDRSTTASREADADAEALKEQQTARLQPEGLDAPVDPDTYVIGPADQFVLVLRGQDRREIKLQVLPEGTILLPNHGAFLVAGMTITELRNRLRESLKKYYKNIDFDLQLVVPRSFVVYVLGEVENPGAVRLNAPFRVSSAVEAAGGVKRRGSRRFIEIVEDGETVRLVDLVSFLSLGDIEANPALKEKQSVYVPPLQAFAQIHGEVWNRGAYEVRPGETISDVIRLAGGTTSFADLDRVILERHSPTGRAEIEHYTSADLDTVVVVDRDHIVIPDARTFGSGDYVLVRGGGGREGKVYIEEGETIADFAPRFYRLVEDHDISRAVIERNLDDGTVEYIKVDLEKVITGEADGNILLENRDIISIPKAENFVYVAGEVTDPGAIPFQRGMPAERYIAMAGGPSRNGSMNKLTIFGKDGTSRGGDRNSTVYRGDTILLERTLSSYVGPIFIGLTSLTSLILSVIAVSK